MLKSYINTDIFQSQKCLAQQVTFNATLYRLFTKFLENISAISSYQCNVLFK